MAPSKTANLFIPKKPKPGAAPPPRPPIARPTKPPPSTVIVVEDEDEPEGVAGVDYDEYKLVSTARHGWKYDIMKLHSPADKTVDVHTWAPPVRLNRKEPKVEEDDGESTLPPVQLVPLLGQDGKPVIGPDGNYVMVNPQGLDNRPYGRPPIVPVANKDPAKDKGKGPAGKGGKPPFGKKKKTVQVFKQSEQARTLRREEKIPWILEDGTGAEFWTGRMENAEKNETHALFLHGAAGSFRFIPMNRWYKFQKRPSFRTFTVEEAEAQTECESIKMAKIAKNRDGSRWLSRPIPLAAAIKAEETKEGILNRRNMTGATLSGGRLLRTVDKGQSLFGDDDDDDGSKRRMRMAGAEGDFDEVEYEEDFADDEERLHQDGLNEDEEKEADDRIKAEYRSMNKQREGNVDESDDELEMDLKARLNGDGKDTKKLLKKLGGYEDESDDEEKNPYASSADSEEEKEQEDALQKEKEKEEAEKREEKLVAEKRAAMEAEKFGLAKLTPTANSRNPSAVPSRSNSPALDKVGRANSRGPSPMPGSPALVRSGSLQPGLGNSLVAQRATSPHRSIKGSASRASSPLATSARAESPNASAPRPPKRKAEGVASPSATDGAEPPSKKVKKIGTPKPNRPASPPLEPFPGMLTEEAVVEFLKKGPATTKECITVFKSYMKDERNKKMLSVWIKKVGIMKDGKIALRKAVP